MQDTERKVTVYYTPYSVYRPGEDEHLTSESRVVQAVPITLPRRSHRTALSDDELLLLDALFDKALPRGALRTKNYRLWLNTAYAPTFTQAQLRQRIASWCEEGILQTEWLPEWIRGRKRNHRGYTLTPIGGALWEAEREPDWNQYCSVWELVGNRETEDTVTFGMRSPSRQIVEDCLAAAQRIGYYPRLPEEPQLLEKTQLDGIEWKTFLMVYEIVVTGTGRPDEDIVGEWYKQKKGWDSVEQISPKQSD